MKDLNCIFLLHNNLGESDERITESCMVRDSHAHLKVSELLYLQSAFT